MKRNYFYTLPFKLICSFIFLVNTSFIFSCQHPSESDTVGSVIISGILENGHTDTLFLVQDHLADRIKFPVMKDGSFHQEISLPYPRFVSLQISRFFKYPIYIESADSFFIRIKNGGMTDESPMFEGEGKDRNNLILGIEYLKDSLQKDAVHGQNTDFNNYTTTLSYNDFNALTGKFHKLTLDYIDIYAPSIQDDTFTQFIYKRAFWDMILSHMKYAVSYKRFHQNDSEYIPSINDSIQEKLALIDLTDPDLLGYDQFDLFIKYALASKLYNSFSEWFDDPATDYKLFDEALKLMNPAVREKASFIFLMELIRSEHADFQKTQFDSIRLNDRYLSAIEKFTKFHYGKDSGVLIPDFVLQEPDGEDFNLSSLKGKFVYIDFWATWCIPCIAEYPFFLKLKEEYNDADIAFVSISLDDKDKEDAWKAFLQRNNMTGYQLKAEKGLESDLREWFEIREIPFFVLIGENRVLINGHAPRPSSPYIRHILDRCIESGK